MRACVWVFSSRKARGTRKRAAPKLRTLPLVRVCPVASRGKQKPFSAAARPSGQVNPPVVSSLVVGGQHGQANRLFSGGHDGEVWVWSVPGEGNDFQLLQVFGAGREARADAPGVLQVGHAFTVHG